MTTKGGINAQWNNPSSYGGGLPPDWDKRRKRVYRRDDWTCTECGQQSGPHEGNNGVRLHAHHIRPRSEGGSNRLSNLTTLCEDCHNAAHSHDITASPGWIGDRERSGGLLDRIIGYVIDAALFGAGTAIGGAVYVFAAWVILYEVTSRLGGGQSGQALWMVGLAGIVLVMVAGLMWWRPKLVAVRSLFVTVVIGVVGLLWVGMSTPLLVAEGISVIPSLVVGVGYGVRRWLA